MSEVQRSCDQSPNFQSRRYAARVLEDSGRLVLKIGQETTATSASEGYVSKEYSVGEYQWVTWSVPRLCLSHSHAMLMLQGASLGQLLGEAYVVLRGSKAPLYSVPPSLMDLCFAEVLKAPENTSRMQVFAFLLANS